MDAFESVDLKTRSSAVSSADGVRIGVLAVHRCSAGGLQGATGNDAAVRSLNDHRNCRDGYNGGVSACREEGGVREAKRKTGRGQRVSLGCGSDNGRYGAFWR